MTRKIFNYFTNLCKYYPSIKINKMWKKCGIKKMATNGKVATNGAICATFSLWIVEKKNSGIELHIKK